MAREQIPGTPAIEANIYADDVAGLTTAAAALTAQIAPGQDTQIDWITANAVQEGTDWTMRATCRIRLMRTTAGPAAPE